MICLLLNRWTKVRRVCVGKKRSSRQREGLLLGAGVKVSWDRRMVERGGGWGVWQVTGWGEEKQKARSDWTGSAGRQRRAATARRTTSSRRSPGWAPPDCWTCWLCAGPGPPPLNPGEQPKQETDKSAGQWAELESKLPTACIAAVKEELTIGWRYISKVPVGELALTKWRQHTEAVSSSALHIPEDEDTQRIFPLSICGTSVFFPQLHRLRVKKETELQNNNQRLLSVLSGKQFNALY